MGVVYKAEDTNLKRNVALKFLPPELISDSNAKKRFMLEAQAASSLDHPNICGIHDIAEDDGQLFIIMTCYDGESLKDMIKRGPLKFEDAMDVAVQIAQGLRCAHQKGIVHRDIKPANIIMTSGRIAKIVDFGLAKYFEQSGITKSGSRVGTTTYMSPEQMRGEEVDTRTDIWSLGVMLYEMITGHWPFRGEHEAAMMYSILNEDPQPMEKFRQGVPNVLKSIIIKSIEKDKGERYQNVNEMLTDLKDAGEHLTDAISISQTAVDKTKPWTKSSNKTSPGENTQPSIAVLPFTNLSTDPENEYFSDGMSEEIINALTKVIGLHVVARTSAFAFKGKNEDIREIGRKLHVENVLEGSVRKSGNRLRITAQLIKISDGYHLWSERFDRTMDDVFTIQDEISLSIVDKLKVTLLESEKGALAKRPTENIQAYHLFLQGRYSINKYTRESLQYAIEKFKKALSLAPNYAEAYAGIGEAYHYLGMMGSLPAQDTYPKAREFAQKAINIDPTIADAHVVLGTVKLFFDWNWEEAENSYKKAIELNPNCVQGRAHFAFFLVCMDRMNESLAQSTAAYSLDPLYSPLNHGVILLRMGRLSEAREQLQKSVEFEPGQPHSLWMMGHVDVMLGRYEEGLSTIRNALALSGNNAMILAGLGWSSAIAGNRAEAFKVLQELDERSKHEHIYPYLSAKIYSALGENDLAFEWLDKAFHEHDYALSTILTDESLAGLHQDPRFDELLKKMKLSRMS